jgi:LuxR family transcriptional regulator, maltose regulon positive regulatory protein
MPRSFRFEPSKPRPGSLTRPRLLRTLVGRWEHRVTLVVGGPGMGKTTLLAQAVAENRLAPRGEDVWIGLDNGDADGIVLARDVMAAVSAEGGDRAAGMVPGTTAEEPDPATVADAVWRRAPTAVCLVVDDVHWLTPGSSGATWFTALVDALPTNGHVLLASRWSPAVPLARLATQSAVPHLAEDDLRFSDDELAEFAARRGIAIGRFDDTGGWPAMAELAASVEHDLAGDYLWEEVLEPLGPERRRVLAVLSDLGGADDGLAGAALGTPVDLARVLDGVPLVAHGAGGWRVPHPLWHEGRALALADDERASTRRRAVDHLVAERRYDEAMTLAHEAGLIDVIPGILRAACIGPRPPGRQLERWLADLPEAMRDTAGAALAAGVQAALLAPAEATEPLQTAIRQCRDAGDPNGELGAIALLGQVAWWRADLGLLAGLLPRVVELEAEGHPLARALSALGQAVLADIVGGDDDVLAHLDAIEPGVLDDTWEAMAAWLRGTTLAGSGRAEESIAVFDAIPPIPDPAFQLNFQGARLEARWALGQVDEVVAAVPSITDGLEAAGVLQFVLVGLAEGAFVFAWVGDVDGAKRLIARVERTKVDADVGQSARLALAEAAMLVAVGNEPAAADLLEQAIAIHGLDSGIDRRVWRRGLALTYVLVPSARDRWDAAELRGHVAQARTLARAVVAFRDYGNRDGFGARVADRVRRRLCDIDLSDMSRVRAGLHHRFAVDLALGLKAAGRPEGATLLEALGPRGREDMRAEAAAGTHRAKLAKSLLAAVPAPPEDRTEIAVLGPLALARNGEPVTERDLRRERVRALLAFLVGHRTTSRAAIMAALWPDLDERAAANNLRVTMTYLLRVLEPGRPARESAYHIRVDGPTVRLVISDWLRIDVDRFNEHVTRAARAEADGTPSLALEHNLAAVALYRGEAHEGVADADWIALERDQFRVRFVAAATRAGELLVARGDVDDAERAARRAVEVDPWAEDAYGVLVSAALARRDRSTARRTLDRTLAALADLGVEPSEETRRLRRRVRSAGGETD